MTRSTIIARRSSAKWTWCLAAYLLLIPEPTQSRVPLPDFEKAFGRPIWPKRALGALTSLRTPVVAPDSVEAELEAEALLVSGESTTGSSAMQQWLELDSIPPVRMSAKLHSEVVLECVAIGSPPPIVFWHKDGKPIESLPIFDSEEFLNGVDAQVQTTVSGFAMAKTKSQLRVPCIRPEDEGEYTCIATQVDGPASSGRRRLTSSSTVAIEEDDKSQAWKPECEFRLPTYLLGGKKGRRGTPAYVHVAESLHMEVIGNDIVLPCRVGGRPRPRIQWFGSDGQPILVGKKYQINSKGDLVIRNLSWTEMGDYRCQAVNAYGTDSASTFLYPLLPEDS